MMQDSARTVVTQKLSGVRSVRSACRWKNLSQNRGAASEQCRPSLGESVSYDSESSKRRGHGGSGSRNGSRRPSEDLGAVGDEVEDQPVRSSAARMLESSETPTLTSRITSVAAETPVSTPLAPKSQQIIGLTKVLGPRDFRLLRRGDAVKRRIGVASSFSPSAPSRSPEGRSHRSVSPQEAQVLGSESLPVGEHPVVGSPSPHRIGSQRSPAAEHRRLRRMSRSPSPPDVQSAVVSNRLQVVGSPPPI